MIIIKKKNLINFLKRGKRYILKQGTSSTIIMYMGRQENQNSRHPKNNRTTRKGKTKQKQHSQKNQ
jgi:hypothetical protein